MTDKGGQRLAIAWVVLGCAVMIWIMLIMIAPNESMKLADMGWNSIGVFFNGLFVLLPALAILLLVTFLA